MKKEKQINRTGNKSNCFQYFSIDINKALHLYILFIGLLLTRCVAFGATQNLPRVEDVFSRALVSTGNQARLQTFFSKAERGDFLTIGVLGGSITKGAACSEARFRYHGVLLNWLKNKFPKARFKLVNAGIGATASDYGALRCERDILSKKPDLVILEFGVNDNPPSKAYAETYEGIVRQILNAPGKPALILLFMMWHDGHNAQKWQAQIGHHYKLPMISYRDALWPEIQAGRLKWKQLSPDIVHPNKSGHVFTGKLLCAYLDKMLEAFRKTKQVDRCSPLPKALFSDLYSKCVIADGKTLKPVSNRGWKYDAGKNSYVSGWISSTPGSVIEFEVPGRSILIAYWRTQKKPMGKVKISIDGTNTVVADGWFNQSWGGKRWITRLAEKLPPGEHRVRVELLKEKNPKSKGYGFRILCIGGAGE